MRVPKNIPDEYLKRVESVSVPKNGRIRRLLGRGGIRAGTEKLSGRVPENGRISDSSGKWKNPGEYSEKVESVPVPKNIPDEYLKMVESVSVPKNCGIWVNTGKR